MFETLQVPPPLVEVLCARGIQLPTPIQDGSIQIIREGQDFIGIAKTGSGKTLAYVLPVLELLSRRPASPFPGAVVIVPARELADQVTSVFNQYGATLGIRSAVLVGGDKKDRQHAAIAGGLDVVVGTPGRLRDLVEAGTLNLSEANILVLDEVDRVVLGSMGEDVEALLPHMASPRQTLFFSATFSDSARTLSRNLQINPRIVRIDSDMPREIRHVIVECEEMSMVRTLVQVLRRECPESCFVFVNRKDEAEEVVTKLKAYGVAAEYFSSRLDLQQRRGRLQRFREGETPVLVATDVLGRGIDIVSMSHVINLGGPSEADKYIHRAGRTGRAGQDGTVISILTAGQARRLRTLLGHQGIVPGTMSVNQLIAGEHGSDNGNPDRTAVTRAIEIPESLMRVLQEYDAGLAQLLDPGLRSRISITLPSGVPVIGAPSEFAALGQVATQVQGWTSANSRAAQSLWRFRCAQQETTLSLGEATAEFAAGVLIQPLMSNGLAADALSTVLRQSVHVSLWQHALSSIKQWTPEMISPVSVRMLSRLPESDVLPALNRFIVACDTAGIPMHPVPQGNLNCVRVQCVVKSAAELEQIRYGAEELAAQIGWKVQLRPLVIENPRQINYYALKALRRHALSGKEPYISNVRGAEGGFVVTLPEGQDLTVGEKRLRQQLSPHEAGVSFQSGPAHQIEIEPPPGSLYVRCKTRRPDGNGEPIGGDSYSH